MCGHRLRGNSQVAILPRKHGPVAALGGFQDQAHISVEKPAGMIIAANQQWSAGEKLAGCAPAKPGLHVSGDHAIDPDTTPHALPDEREYPSAVQYREELLNCVLRFAIRGFRNNEALGDLDVGSPAGCGSQVMMFDPSLYHPPPVGQIHGCTVHQPTAAQLLQLRE